MTDLTPEKLAELRRLLDETKRRLSSPRRAGKTYAMEALRKAAVNALPALLDAAAERDALAAKLDADGLPVVRTVGDLIALDALPVGSVVMEGSSGAPLQVGPFGIPVMPGVFHRFPDGWHVVSGYGVRTPEFDLGPLAVLHIPCEVLP